jgi:hypothetical protein
VDLRLTIPADAAYRPIAGELAVKFAEYAGAAPDAAARLGKAIDAAATTLSDGGGELTLDLDAHDGEVTVTVAGGGRTLHSSCVSTTH